MRRYWAAFETGSYPGRRPAGLCYKAVRLARVVDPARNRLQAETE
jgi:hypothetical protein